MASGNQWNAGRPADDLAARVAELEVELKKMQDKEAAAREEAAGVPSLDVSGRIMVDWALFDQSPNNRATYGDWGDRCEIRRGRIGVSGEAFHVVDYELEMDFADNPRAPTDGSIFTGLIQSTSFKDAYITIKELPWLGHLRIGHQKEPFGLEQANSTRFTTFMERSMCDENAFVPGRNLGIMAFDHTPG